MTHRKPFRGMGLMTGGVLLVLVAGTRHPGLIEQRKREALQTVAPSETTPLVALTTVAFGGFRGLVADALWVRANTLQERGQFFELVQLAQWITQLEPRVPEVWGFQAWNLAYNISVLFPDHGDRWRWVGHGIELLKREGLAHNPSSASLHWDIGWMYQHKIGMDFDLAHALYKRRLAEQVEAGLPDGHLPSGTIPAGAREVLTREFHMRLDTLRKLEADFGPLDWRLPETHSLYWATRGLELRASELRIRALERMRQQSLSTLMRGGRMLRDPETGSTLLLPRLDLIPVVVSTYERMLEGESETHYLQLGLRNILADAVVLYAEYGRMTESLDMYEKLAERVEEIPPGRENFQRFVQGVLGQDPGSLTPRQAMTRVVALLRNAGRPGLGEVRARGFTRMAEQVHRLFQESRINEEHLQRTGLPPFEAMRRMLEDADPS